MADVHDNPSNVDAEDGVVIVDGPGGTSITMTARAAAETSERFSRASAKAAGQQAAEGVCYEDLFLRHSAEDSG